MLSHDLCEDIDGIVIHKFWPFKVGEGLFIEYLLASDDSLERVFEPNRCAGVPVRRCRQSLLSKPVPGCTMFSSALRPGPTLN